MPGLAVGSLDQTIKLIPLVSDPHVDVNDRHQVPGDCAGQHLLTVGDPVRGVGIRAPGPMKSLAPPDADRFDPLALIIEDYELQALADRAARYNRCDLVTAWKRAAIPKLILAGRSARASAHPTF